MASIAPPNVPLGKRLVMSSCSACVPLACKASQNLPARPVSDVHVKQHHSSVAATVLLILIAIQIVFENQLEMIGILHQRHSQTRDCGTQQQDSKSLQTVRLTVDIPHLWT